jgi:hypothetical protein
LDKKAFSEIQERLLEVNKLVTKLDSSIRVAAFDFLKPYILGGNIKAPSHEQPALEDVDDTSTADLAASVEKYGGDDKPADNAKLLSAWWFSQYGSAPFSTRWVKATGNSTGLTMPDKPDMTYRQARAKGKKLYNALGQGGLFKPMIVGEAVLKTTYKVKKGTKIPPVEK